MLALAATHMPHLSDMPLQGRVRSGDVELAVRRWGDPRRPTVVLVHGYPDSSEIWGPLAQLLSNEFHVVAYDVRGAGLFLGVNDLRHDLRIPADASRTGLMLALQTVILAARAAGQAVFDGVYNRLDDDAGLRAECREGRALGFDGKTLIHPNQIAAANAIFGPDEAEIAEARALIAAATGGAERYQGRMIETMHVAQARAVLERARATD